MDSVKPAIIEKLTADEKLTFYEISGVEDVMKVAEHVKIGSDDAYKKAAEELVNILQNPDPPELLCQLIGPPNDLTEEEAFIWLVFEMRYC